MDSYESYLLEYLAYRISPGNLEFEQWRKDFNDQYRTATTPQVSEKTVESKPSQNGGAIYAGEISSTKEILRDVRAQSETRSGEVPRYEQGKDVGVRVNLGEKLTAAFKSKK